MLCVLKHHLDVACAKTYSHYNLRQYISYFWNSAYTFFTVWTNYTVKMIRNDSKWCCRLCEDCVTLSWNGTRLCFWFSSWFIKSCHSFTGFPLLNEWSIYIVLYCVLLYTKALYNHIGVSPQPPPVCSIHLDDCNGSHRTTAPVRSPHTSYRWRGERDRANQVDGDY